MNLGGRLDEVLQVSPGVELSECQISERVEGNEPQEEVTEVHEFAVSFVFDIDDTPAVLTTTDGLAVDDHVALRADNSEGDHALRGYRSDEITD